MFFVDMVLDGGQHIGDAAHTDTLDIGGIVAGTPGIVVDPISDAVFNQ